MSDEKFIVVLPQGTVWGSKDLWQGYPEIMDKEGAIGINSFHRECGIESKVAKLDFNWGDTTGDDYEI